MGTAVKERPILFSGPMVRAILEGRKTQTRRVLNLPRGLDWYGEIGGEAEGWFTNGEGWWHVEELACRYGNPGDRLWVRETLRQKANGHFSNSPHAAKTDWVYSADDTPISPKYHLMVGWAAHRSKPSIHMPRWASRITLEITGVRVERLNEISEEDARAEGVSIAKSEDGSSGYGEIEGLGRFPQYSLRWGFEHLWESINGEGSWAANPWVWVVEFKRIG